MVASRRAGGGGGKPDALHGHQIFPFVLGS